MKLLLISASLEEKVRPPSRNTTYYPLGLAYLHAYLEKQGNTVETLFMNDYPYDDCYRTVLDKLKDFRPEVVGFNILTSNRVSTCHLIGHIHEHFPEMKILIGGIHTSAMYDQLIRKYPYVVAVVGEGELTAAELLAKFGKNEPIDGVAGIAFNRGGEVVLTPARPLISDLDELPFPKHEVFFYPDVIAACILTTRGCPFRCSFCALDLVSRGKVRYRSIGNVMAELEHIKKVNPKIKRIWIHDDTFFLKNERVVEFCDEVVKRKLDFEFICSARFKPISEKIVPALERAGFSTVLFGLESGAPSVLQRAGKHITPEDALYAVGLFKDSPITVGVFLIVGLSGENDGTIKETIDLVVKLQKIKYLLYLDEPNTCFVYPGTQLYELAKQAGQLQDDYWLTDKPIPFFTVEHTEAELAGFGEKLFDHIALGRIFTFRGFLAQAKMLPYILRHLAKLPFFARLEFLNTAFYRFKDQNPAAYRALRFFYRNVKSGAELLKKGFR